MLVIIAILMVAVATYLLYKGHVENSKSKLITALLLTLGGIFILYYAAGGKL